jgi:MFS family permease
VGLSSVLPLYGLSLGLPAASAAALVAASGAGSAIVVLPMGLLADRWHDKAAGRRALMQASATMLLALSAASLWVGAGSALVWALVFGWGAAGGCLYTLAMIAIGSRSTGLSLLNATAVLVMAYTLGGLVASASVAALLDLWPVAGVPMLLIAVAVAGLIALLRSRST